MKFFWRHSETSAGEKLVAFTGLDKDIDDTPVAMFEQANGREIGLSMNEIGELVEHHNQLLYEGSAMPAPERSVVEKESALAREGAEAISFRFNELLDDRLRPYTPRREQQPGAAQKAAYDSLMQRLRPASLRKD